MGGGGREKERLWLKESSITKVNNNTIYTTTPSLLLVSFIYLSNYTKIYILIFKMDLLFSFLPFPVGFSGSGCNCNYLIFLSLVFTFYYFF